MASPLVYLIEVIYNLFLYQLFFEEFESWLWNRALVRISSSCSIYSAISSLIFSSSWLNRSLVCKWLPPFLDFLNDFILYRHSCFPYMPLTSCLTSFGTILYLSPDNTFITACVPRSACWYERRIAQIFLTLGTSEVPLQTYPCILLLQLRNKIWQHSARHLINQCVNINTHQFWFISPDSIYFSRIGLKYSAALFSKSISRPIVLSSFEGIN